MKLQKLKAKRLKHLRFMQRNFPSLYRSALSELRSMAKGESCYGLREDCYPHPEKSNETVPDSFFVGLLQELGEKA